MTWRKRIRLVWATCGLGFTAWIMWNLQAHGVPADVYQSSDMVEVARGDHATVLVPSAPRSDRAFLVFLPGGAVDPDAYAPVVRRMAEAGWPVALVELPWRSAFTENARREVWRRIEAAREAHTGGRALVLGGHSRGAALSAAFTSEHSSDVSGLFLIGTTHPRDHDLSGLEIPVVKLSGTRDCVAPEDDARANAPMLPPATTWVSIAGANHAQFGFYGTQLGDCSAAIERREQQSRLLDALLRWLDAHFGKTPAAPPSTTAASSPAM